MWLESMPISSSFLQGGTEYIVVAGFDSTSRKIDLARVLSQVASTRSTATSGHPRDQ